MPDTSNVFPDPDGAKRPENRHRPRSVEEWINHAIMDIDDNVTWETREGAFYCHLCAPGGYRLKDGASPYMHETQRNPDTHKRNRIWAVIQWFKVRTEPPTSIPRWPDCYRETREGLLWCHICRTVRGSYGQQDGEAHDLWHDSQERIIMRPNRLLRKEGTKRSIGQRKRHVIDEILASRRDDYGEDQVIVDKTPVQQPGAWKQWIPVDMPIARDPNLVFARNNETNMFDHVHPDVLDAWVEHGDTRWRAACATYDLCEGLNHPRPCIGEGCECSCHGPIETASDEELGARPS